MKYEDLKSSPMPVLRKIYATLGLGDFSTVEPIFAARISAGQSYEPTRFSLEPDAIATIDDQWHDFFDRYGYPRMSERGRVD